MLKLQPIYISPHCVYIMKIIQPIYTSPNYVYTMETPGFVHHHRCIMIYLIFIYVDMQVIMDSYLWHRCFYRDIKVHRGV